MSVSGHVARGVDAVAEASVVLSFSKLGFAMRSRLEHWEALPRLDGRTAVVTGATSGIGLAASVSLAALGANVHLVGRDAQRADAARDAVAKSGSGRVEVHLVDMSDAAAVAAFGTRLAGEGHLDVLVHNAGALLPAFRTTPAGVEVTVATHVLGPYVLTATLAPLLCARSGTIVTVTSGGMYAQRFDLERLESGPVDYDGVVAYARAKRAQVVLADAWADRFAASNVTSASMHPGWVDTPGLEAGLPGFHRWCRPLLRTPEEGADTVCWLATGGAAGGDGPGRGLYLDRRRRSVRRPPVLHPTQAGDGTALLAWCAARTGVETPSS